MSLSPIRLAAPFLLPVLNLCGFSQSTPARENHAHHHHHGSGCSHSHDHGHHHEAVKMKKLPEELAEEEDMRLCGFGPCLHHHHDHQSNSTLFGFALWVNALGCSLLVSLASLICLILLPLMFVQGKPAKRFVDALALFGAGAMLGDAFLHQLPHAFAGIVLFLLVEKLVRYVEENSSGSNTWGHHHHAGSSKKLKDEDDHNSVEKQCPSENSSEKVSKDKSLRKRKTSSLVFGYLNLFSDGVVTQFY